jgi:hypothetical protein
MSILEEFDNLTCDELKWIFLKNHSYQFKVHVDNDSIFVTSLLDEGWVGDMSEWGYQAIPSIVEAFTNIDIDFV